MNKIDRILVEAAPGEIRAVACCGDRPVDVFHERPLAQATVGDIYRARAGDEGPNGARFFDLGGGVAGMTRRPRPGWTDGAYGLVQILRGEAGDKGPRVSDRVWLEEGGFAVSLAAGVGESDRIEIARRIPKHQRQKLRAAIADVLPEDGAVKVAHAISVERAEALPGMFERLRGYCALTGAPRRVHAAAGEIGWLVAHHPDAAWAPSDPATAAWLAGLECGPTSVEAPDRTVAIEIDQTIASANEIEISLDCGARLWIEGARALTAIDVDQVGSDAPASEINAQAGAEIARQLRLRRIGGLIAIDFLREGLASGLKALEAAAGDDDPWPWAAPTQADASGLVSFQRARLGPSTREISTGEVGRAYGALRAALRATGGAPPRVLAASPEIVHLLQTDLHDAKSQTDARLGAPLDLRREQGLRSIRLLGGGGDVLVEI